MIEVDSLLYKIDQRLNKLSTNFHQQIPLEDKILALNEGQLKLITQKMDGISTPSNAMGFDSFKKRYEDLENLVVDYGEGALSLTLKDPMLNQWSAKVSDLKKKFMFYVDSYILADKGECKNHRVWNNPGLAKHGDLMFLLNNEDYAPSFEYQETICFISSDEISVFTDGSFTPTKIYVSYIRYPQYIDKEGYTKFDGSASQNSDCELAPYLEGELLDITVQNLAMFTENGNAVQSSQMRIQTNE